MVLVHDNIFDDVRSDLIYIRKMINDG